MPGRDLDRFLTRLDEGALDAWLTAVVASSEDRGSLVGPDQTGSLGVFSRLGPGDALVPAERDPVTGLLGGSGGAGSRQQKQHQEEEEAPGDRSWLRRMTRRPKLLAAAVAGVVVLVGAGAAIAVGGNGSAPKAAPHSVPPVASATATTPAVPLSGLWRLALVAHRIPDNTNTSRTITQPMTGVCDGKGPCGLDMGFGLVALTPTGSGYHYEGSTRQNNPNDKCPAGVWQVALDMTMDLTDPLLPRSIATFSIDPGVYLKTGAGNATCRFNGEAGSWIGTPVPVTTATAGSSGSSAAAPAAP